MATESEMREFALKLVKNRRFRKKFLKNPKKVSASVGIEFTNNQLYDLIRIMISNYGLLFGFRDYQLEYLLKNKKIFDYYLNRILNEGTDAFYTHGYDFWDTLNDDEKTNVIKFTNDELWYVLCLIFEKLNEPSEYSSGSGSGSSSDGKFVDFW